MRKLILLLIASFYLQICLANDIYHWKAIDKDFDRLAALCETANFNDDSRKNFLATVKQMEAIAAKKGDRQLQARALFWKTWQRESTPTDSCLRWNERAINLTDTVAYRYDYLRLLLYKASLLRVKGQYLEAYTLCKKVGEEWTVEEEWFCLGKAEVQLGAILGELGEHALALRYYRKAGDDFKRANNLISETKNRINISTALYYTNDTVGARQTLTELSADPIAKRDTSFYINVLASLASIPDKHAKEWASRAWQLSLKMGVPQLLCLSATNMGALMLEEKYDDTALRYYQEALKYCHTCTKGMQIIVFQGLQESFNRLGMADSAAHYAQRLEETASTLEAQNEVSELEKRSIVQKINRLEAESQQAKQHADGLQKTVWAIIMVCIAFLIGAGLLIQQANKKKRLKEHENRKLQRANNKIKTELDTKDRVLVENSIVETERLQLLKDLQEEINTLREAHRISDEDEQRLNKKLSSGIAQKQWEDFRIRIEKATPQLLSRLKARCPSLSEKELRLCVYIRTGLTTKEIASMNNVLPETINTARYRLRKKLDLPKELSLEDFLRSV